MQSTLTRWANRFARRSPLVVGVLAVAGLVVSLLILLWPGAFAGLSSQADVSTAVATIFALSAAIVGVTSVVWISTSDYKAEQAVKADTARLRAALRSIMVKWALLTQKRGDPTRLDFKAECKVLNDFLSSTTAFGYWSWVEERSSAAKEGTDEPWRVLYLYLASLLDACERPGDRMIGWAVRLERLFADLTRDDINRISSYVADLAGVLGKATESKDVLLSAVSAVLVSAVSDSDGDTTETDAPMTEWKFRHLKNKGVVDPNVDLFIAVFDNETADLQRALEAGADTSTTDKQLLAKYKDELDDFNPADWTSAKD